MELPTLERIESAAEIVYQHMLPTPQYRWPLLEQKYGLDLWLKHENHTPLGAFKVRGGLVYFDQLAKQAEPPTGVVSATRGNHGQSVAFAASQNGLKVKIVVPHGNSKEKNAAMVALGADLIEAGDDFQDAIDAAHEIQLQEGLHLVSSFHEHLVWGVATYGLELFQGVEELDVVYVPVGMGSGFSGVAAARKALGLNTEIVGVTSAHAPAFLNSYEQNQVVEKPAETQLADGVAARRPLAEALDIVMSEASRVVAVTDDEVKQAMRDVFECTHNVVEGAAATAVAAVQQERGILQGKKVAAILTGGNIDREVFAQILG